MQGTSYPNLGDTPPHSVLEIQIMHKKRSKNIDESKHGYVDASKASANGKEDNIC